MSRIVPGFGDRKVVVHEWVDGRGGVSKVVVPDPPKLPEGLKLRVLEEGFSIGAVAHAFLNALTVIGLIAVVLLGVIKCNPDDHDSPPPPACLAKEAKQ